jgi:hypothetical protein
VCRLEPTDGGERSHALVGAVRSAPQGRRVGQAAQKTLLEAAFVSVELANRFDEIALMTVFGRTLRRFRVAPFEPGPNTLIVSVGKTLGKVVSFFVKAGKECADRLLVCLAHNINDGPWHFNKQAWPCPSNLS